MPDRLGESLFYLLLGNVRAVEYGEPAQEEHRAELVSTWSDCLGTRQRQHLEVREVGSRRLTTLLRAKRWARCRFGSAGASRISPVS